MTENTYSGILIPVNTTVNNQRMTQRERRGVLSLWRKSGYKQIDFARDMGVHRSAVSMWARGKRTSRRLDVAAKVKAAELHAGTSSDGNGNA